MRWAIIDGAWKNDVAVWSWIVPYDHRNIAPAVALTRLAHEAFITFIEEIE